MQHRLEVQNPPYVYRQRFRRLIHSIDPCKGKDKLVHVYILMADKE
jgi:hypothetical protein